MKGFGKVLSNLGLVVVSVAFLSVLVAAEGSLAQSIAGLLGIALVGLALVAMLLTITALWPHRSRRIRANLEGSPGKSLLIGLVNYCFIGAIAAVFLNLGPLAFIGLILLALLAAGSLVGLSAMAGLLGERLYDLRAQQASRLAQLVAGGSGLYLAALLPFIGWFVLIPGLLLVGFGAFALSLANRQREDSEVVSQEIH